MCYRISPGYPPYQSPLHLGALIDHVENIKINLNKHFPGAFAGFSRNDLGSLRGQQKKKKTKTKTKTMKKKKKEGSYVCKTLRRNF